MKKNRLISLILSIEMGVFGIIELSTFTLSNKYKLVNSPYDGSQIKVSDEQFNNNLKNVVKYFNEKLSDIEIDKLISEMDEYQKKNYTLMHAIISNPSFSKEEINNLSGYINYLNDNPYVNYEDTYKLLKSCNIYNKDLKKIAGRYNHITNEITYINNGNSIMHEIFHLEDMYLHENIYNAEFQDWFIEACAEVLAEEYQPKEDTTYNVVCAALRLIIRFIGSDVILKARSTGNFNIITEALINKGIDKNSIIKLYKFLNKYNHSFKNCSLSDEKMKELRKEISDIFVNMYLKVNKDESENIDPLFIKQLDNLIYDRGTNLQSFKEYEFNNLEKQNMKNCNAIEYKDIEKIYLNDGAIFSPVTRFFKDDHIIIFYEKDGNFVSDSIFYTIDDLKEYTKENLDKKFEQIKINTQELMNTLKK